MQIKNDKEWRHMSDEYNKVKYYCKKCGHSLIIPNWIDKGLCDWCGKYVFKNDKDEFNYRMRGIINDKNKQQNKTK